MISIFHPNTQPTVSNPQPNHLRRTGKCLAFISVLAAASLCRTALVNQTLPQSLRGSSKSNRLNVITADADQSDAAKNATHIAHTQNLARLLQATPDLSIDVINETRASLPLLAQTGFDAALGVITTLKMLTTYSSDVELGDIVTRPVIAMLSEAEFLAVLKNLANEISESILTKVLPDLLKNADFQTAVNEFIDSILTEDLINTLSDSTSEALEKVLTNFVNNPKIQEAIGTLITNTSENPALLRAVDNVVNNAIATGSDTVFASWATPKFFLLLAASTAAATAVAVTTALFVLHCYQKACGGKNSIWSQAGKDVAKSVEQVTKDAFTDMPQQINALVNGAIANATSADNTALMQGFINNGLTQAINTVTNQENAAAMQGFASATIKSAVTAATSQTNKVLMQSLINSGLTQAINTVTSDVNKTAVQNFASATVNQAVNAATSQPNKELLQNFISDSLTHAFNTIASDENKTAVQNFASDTVNQAVTTATTEDNKALMQNFISDSLTHAFNTIASDENKTAVQNFASATVNQAVNAATSQPNKELMQGLISSGLTQAFNTIASDVNKAAVQNFASDTVNQAVNAATSEANTSRLQALAKTTIVSAIDGATEVLTNKDSTASKLLENANLTLQTLAVLHGHAMATHGGAVLGNTLVARSIDTIKGAATFPIHKFMAIVWMLWGQLPSRTTGAGEPAGDDEIPNIADDPVIANADQAIANLALARQEALLNTPRSLNRTLSL